MTRLQKKCVVGAAGTHLLIIVVLFCSGFIKPSTKVENADVLTAIPANIVENALNQGVQNAPPPTPQPPQLPTPPQPPTPPPPTPAVTQPPPVPLPPKIQPVEPVKPVEPEPDKNDVTPAPPKPKPPKPTPPKIQIDLTPVVRKTTDTAEKAVEQQREAERQAKRDALKRQKAIMAAANSIESKASASTEVSVPRGDSAAAVANYASVVKTYYTQAWNPPDDAKNDEANVKVRVTIQSDGTVSAARIIDRSGDSGLDDSVQRALDRIHSLEPFPSGMNESEHTYTINFNLKAKRQAE